MQSVTCRNKSFSDEERIGREAEVGDSVPAFPCLFMFGCSRHAGLDPKRLDAAFKDIRDLSGCGDTLVRTLVGVVENSNFRRRPESERWDVELLRTLMAGRASC